jgi:hypothetical protein
MFLILEVNNGNLYVVCGGKPVYAASETAGKLVKVNLANNTSSTVNFAAATHPSNLDIEGNDVLLYCGC